MDSKELKALITGEDPRAVQMGGDFYTAIASIWLSKKPKDVTPEERNVVKTYAFPWMYGRRKVCQDCNEPIVAGLWCTTCRRKRDARLIGIEEDNRAVTQNPNGSTP